jgi:phage protein U
MFAILGSIQFSTVGSPQSLEQKFAYKYAKHEVVESKPRLQAIAPELDEFSFTLILHASLGSPEARLLQMKTAMNAAMAMPLVLGNGTHLGKFVILDIATTGRKYTATGDIISIEVKVTLQEYASGAEADPEAPPQPATTPPALVEVTASQAAATPGGVAGTIVTNPNGTTSVVFLSDNMGTSALLTNPGPGGPATPNLNFTSVPASTMVRAAA